MGQKDEKLFFEEDLRRCSREAGDPQGGCKNNHLYCQKQRSMWSAKRCGNYKPKIVSATKIEV